MLNWFWKTLKSLKFAIIILSVIAVLSIAGTLIPQNADPHTYHKLFGLRLTEFLNFLGFFDIFHTPYYILSLILLCLSLLACGLSGISFRLTSISMMLTHLSIILICIGALVTFTFGERGYVGFSEGERIDKLLDSSGEVLELPFTLELEDFHLEYYQEQDKTYKGELIIYNDEGEFQNAVPVEEGKTFTSNVKGTKISIRRVIPDFVMDMDTREMKSRSPEFNNPALLLEAENDIGKKEKKWVFAKHPDFHGSGDSALFPLMLYLYERDIKDFVSVVNVYENERKILNSRISMNKPLKHKGWMFYQVSYDQNRPDWTKLEVSRDPGVIFIYFGSFLLCLGVTMIFYINPLIRKRGRKNG